jgi:hypothetical protein
MYLTWTKSNAEAAMKQNALATKRHKKAQDRVDRRITPLSVISVCVSCASLWLEESLLTVELREPIVFKSNDEGLHVLSLLSVLLLLQRDGDAVCGRERVG